MLQLEEIAARMRQGKLELPLDDQSRVLKEERDELKKRLSMKDHEIAQHIDRKVDEVLQKQGKTKDLEVKLEAIQKDNEILKSSLEAYRSAYANLAQ
ncbi:Vesicle transport protein, partial [Durusdinium trenchii]